MSSEIETRPATSADLEEIRRIATRAWHAAHAPIIGTETTEEFLEAYYDADSLRSLVADDSRLLEVAVDRDRERNGGEDADVIGFAAAGPTDEGPGTTYALSRIYVRPDRWGEGIGRRLLERIERSIDRRDGDRLELSVMAENDRAVTFYESAGFRRDGEFYDERIDTRSYTYVKGL